jgi:DNA polymerase IV (DinB-like DNA polymerase)
MTKLRKISRPTLLINHPSHQKLTTRNQSIIFHVDMDHFFTAIEAREHLEYQRNALIVGANPKKGYGRGVVSTCNYQARKYGITSGMPISQAWKRCPSAIFLPPNYHLYRAVSNQIMEILQTYAHHFEPYGIDEAFLDMSDLIDVFDDADDVARSIKQDILLKTQLTCSIGVGPTKLIAKMASEFQKPDGLTMVHKADVLTFLSPLSVRKLWGVGEKTQQKMNALDIITIKDLMNHEPSALFNACGAKARYLNQLLQSISPRHHRLQSAKRIRKSISKEHTFSNDIQNQHEIFRIIDLLSRKIHIKTEKRQYWFKTITIKIRYENFETHTYSSTLRFLTCHVQKLCDEARRLGRRHLIRDRYVRLIGVKISNIRHIAGQQTLLSLQPSAKTWL